MREKSAVMKKTGGVVKIADHSVSVVGDVDATKVQKRAKPRRSDYETKVEYNKELAEFLSIRRSEWSSEGGSAARESQQAVIELVKRHDWSAKDAVSRENYLILEPFPKYHLTEITLKKFREEVQNTLKLFTKRVKIPQAMNRLFPHNNRVVKKVMYFLIVAKNMDALKAGINECKRKVSSFREKYPESTTLTKVKDKKVSVPQHSSAPGPLDASSLGNDLMQVADGLGGTAVSIVTVGLLPPSPLPSSHLPCMLGENDPILVGFPSSPLSKYDTLIDVEAGCNAKPRFKTKNKWTSEETEALKAGVAKYQGESRSIWMKISTDDEFKVALQNKQGHNVLKDKYRLLLKKDTDGFTRRGSLAVPSGWEKMLRDLLQHLPAKTSVPGLNIDPTEPDSSFLTHGFDTHRQHVANFNHSNQPFGNNSMANSDFRLGGGCVGLDVGLGMPVLGPQLYMSEISAIPPPGLLGGMSGLTSPYPGGIGGGFHIPLPMGGMNVGGLGIHPFSLGLQPIPLPLPSSSSQFPGFDSEVDDDSGDDDDAHKFEYKK